MSDRRQAPEQGIEYSKIRAVLFDYGGVLADEGFHLGLTVIAHNNMVSRVWLITESRKPCPVDCKQPSGAFLSPVDALLSEN